MATLSDTQNDRRRATVEVDFRQENTDLGNSKRFVQQHGRDLRYAKGLGWLRWDGSRWRRDTRDSVYELAKSTVMTIYEEAKGEPDSERRKQIARWAAASQSASHIEAMVKLARTDPAIAVDAGLFDADPYLLNVANGTIDLRRGRLRGPRRADYITRQSPVPYRRGEAAPTFEAFIRRILPNSQTRKFVRRALGYALTGDVSEDALFIFYGAGANGKTTLVEAVLDILADYGKTAAPGLLTVRHNDTHPTELADLQGARAVMSSELEDGARLAEAMVKRATGGDTITARRMRQDFFSFQPTHKLFLITNHKPIVRGTDNAIWRRIKLVPFDVTIPERQQDKQLSQKLKEEYPGILCWLVRGCRGWKKYGLGEPAEVRAATREYRADSDVLGAFIDEACRTSPTAHVTPSTIYKVYASWSQGRGERPMTQNSLGRRLSELGYEKGRSKLGKRLWLGLEVKTISIV